MAKASVPSAPAHDAAQSPLTSLGYVRAGSAIAHTDPTTTNSARREDYVTRRYALFHGSDAHAPLDAVAMSAISRLPLALQVAFRLKMLTIFALQLLLVWAVVTVFRFHPQAKDLADRFFDPPVARIVVAFVAALVLLVALYFGRNAFPLNWLLLLLFSGAQSFCFVGLGVVLDTNIGVFNCGFTFACLLIMILLSGMRRRRKQHDSLEESISSEGEGELLSSFAAGAIAYLVAAAATCVLFAIFRHELMTDVGFAATLGFQLVLIGWFAYDASSMYRVMSPDEYMHGVIYFYTDLILLVLIIAAAVGATVAIMACVAGCGDSAGDCGDGGCGDGGCGTCYCYGCTDPYQGRGEESSTNDGVMHRV